MEIDYGVKGGEEEERSKGGGCYKTPARASKSAS